jgi:hypothetical protein
VEQDPFISFLSNLTEKISVEKEHKALMEKINSDQPAPTVSPLEETLYRLQEKISQQVQAHIDVTTPKEEIKKVIVEPIKEEIVVAKEEEEVLEEENFGDFVTKLKDILASTKETKSIKEEKKKEEEVPKVVEVKKKEESPVEVNNYIQELEKQAEAEPDAPTNNYVAELDKISSKVAGVVEPDKVQDIKKLLEEYMEKYLKKAAILSEYAGGGGSVAQQFANGGTMKGTLNVTGQYLSGGVDLASIFTGGGGGGYQTLSFNSTNANLSISNGNTVSLSALSATGGTGDPAVNSLVRSNSANWNNSYTTLTASSGNWQSTYTTVSSNSANWNSAYQSLSTQAYTLFPSTSTILPTVGNNQSIGSRCSYVGSGQNNKICATNSSSYAGACNYNVSIFSGCNNTVFACSQGLGNDTGAFICNTFIGGGVGNSAITNTGNDDGHIQNSAILNGCNNFIIQDGWAGGSAGGICTSTIVGGTCNALSGYCITDSVIGGGSYNKIVSNSNSNYSLQYIVVAGGYNNTASGCYASGSVIGGGFNNCNLGNYGVIVGGNTNKITSCCGGNFIGGGTYITICGYNGSSVIGGGYRNTTSGYSGSDVIVGGSSNTSSAYYGNNFIGAGNYNCIDGSSSGCTTGSSVIVGGTFNYILGCNSAVVGGAYNSLSASQAFIGGGFQNTGSGNYSAILGGRCNNDNGNTNVFILGSNITAVSANYTYVNNLSSQGIIADQTGTSNNWNTIYNYTSANFAAKAPSYYMVDTTTQGVTATLPSITQKGLVVGFMDPYKTWATNNFVLSAPILIEGQNQPIFMNLAGFAIKAVYVGGNQGWKLTQ